MRTLTVLIASLISLAAASQAMAWDDIFARCGPFKGRTIGVGGSEEKHKRLDFPDGMSGEYQILYRGGDAEARVIGPGKSPTVEDAIVIKWSDEQLSMVVVYPVSVFLYTLFPERRKLMITKHTHARGFEFDAARGFVMVGDCSKLDVYKKAQRRGEGPADPSSAEEGAGKAKKKPRALEPFEVDPEDLKGW